MTPFNWSEHFVTDLPLVDEQHHRLVDIVNQLGVLVDEDNCQEHLTLSIIDELLEYTSYHFKSEESLMQSCNVDSRHVERHLIEHKQLLQEIGLFKKQSNILDVAVIKQLFKIVTHWLAFHILGCDQDMANQIKLIKEKNETPEKAYMLQASSHDRETAILLNSLHGLIDVLSTRHQELMGLAISLESKLAERTKELSVLNANVQKMALTDSLTGLPNRRYAMQEISRYWADPSNKTANFSCLMIDADYFKEVNDTFGHDAGDVVLCQLARVLKESLHNSDTICRLGGDEFFIICPGTDQQGALKVANRLHQSVHELAIPTGDGGTWYGSISIGIATRTEEMDNYDMLIKIADQGVSLAKKEGKNCIRTVQ